MPLVDRHLLSFVPSRSESVGTFEHFGAGGGTKTSVDVDLATATSEVLELLLIDLAHREDVAVEGKRVSEVAPGRL
jgi:hypothetical protein